MNSFYDDLLKIGDKYIDFNNNGIIIETPDIKIVDNQQNNKNTMKAFVFSEYENIIEEEKGKFKSAYKQFCANTFDCTVILDGLIDNTITSMQYAQASKNFLKNKTYLFNNYIDGYNAVKYPVAIKLYRQLMDINNKIVNKYSYMFIICMDANHSDIVYCKVFKNLNKLIDYHYACVDYTSSFFSYLYMAQPVKTKQIFYNRNDIYNNQEELIKFKTAILNKNITVNNDIYITVKNLDYYQNKFPLFEGIILTIFKQEYNNNKKVKYNE